MDKRWFVLLGLLVVLGYFALTSFKTASVVLNYEEDYNQGEKLSGSLMLGLEEGDSVLSSTPMIVSLSKGNSVLASKTLTFKEFIGLSGKSVQPVKKDKEEFYEEVGTYAVPIAKVIDYTFSEKGQYELIFFIPKLDITKVTKITVE